MGILSRSNEPHRRTACYTLCSTTCLKLSLHSHTELGFFLHVCSSIAAAAAIASVAGSRLSRCQYYEIITSPEALRRRPLARLATWNLCYYSIPHIILPAAVACRNPATYHELPACHRPLLP
ncbi:hypothetical protein BDW02DRAFT_355797 [Decorospora gaudefroyi]|uniref:Uncharacterized protein n=1 Tax=Decorospora gaudefroyi TaxID=184978 RepID=A0A6A5KEW1_9PLEO|nr:hypothetical protein BDW02DRAFT_355797 [Decorospora gaudefroyi]